MSRDGDIASFRHPWSKRPKGLDSLRESIDHHPSVASSDQTAEEDTLMGWAKAVQDNADQNTGKVERSNNVHRLEDHRPSPDTVTAFGRLIVSIAGPDKDYQSEVLEKFIGATRPFHDFVEKYIDIDNAEDFIHAFRCIVEEKLEQDNHNQGE